MVLCAGTGAELEDSLAQWRRRLERFALRINMSETQYLVCKVDDRVSDEAWKVKLDGVELERVEEFKYLG